MNTDLEKKQKRLTTYARRRHLVERYKYWSDVKRLREDDIERKLQYEECFFSPSMQQKILKNFIPNPELDKQIEELKRVKQWKENTSQLKLKGL